MTEPPFRVPNPLEPSLEATHEPVRIVPRHDPATAYRIAVPRGMFHIARAVAAPHPGRPEPIGLFVQEESAQGARIVVTVQRLAWEVDPLSWVRGGWSRAGWHIARARRIEAAGRPSASPARFEVAGLRERHGRSEVRRAFGWVDGGRLFRVDVSAPLEQWPQWHDRMWHCAMSVRLRAATDRRRVEALVPHRARGVCFAAPESWWVGQVATAPLRWLATAERGVQRGMLLWIESGESQQPPEVRRRALVSQLRIQGIAVQGPGAAASRREFAAALPGWQGEHRWRIVDTDQPREVRIAHRQVGQRAVDYVLVVPAPTAANLDWMRGVRAHEIAITTTAVHP